MAMSPEQFDVYIKTKSAELTDAWKAIPPTANEVIAKAILDYQYKATVALMNAIQEMNNVISQRDFAILEKLEEIEKRFKKEE